MIFTFPAAAVTTQAQSGSAESSRRVLQELRAEMRSLGDNCVGLASNQIGSISTRVFIALGLDVINPIIRPCVRHLRLGTAQRPERCFSVPGQSFLVTRPNCIYMAYEDAAGTYQPLPAHYEGFMAQVIQHEYDHLEGILITRGTPLPASLTDRPN